MLTLVSEGDAVPQGSSVGDGDGDQAAASPGQLGLGSLGGPPGGGVLGPELSAGSGGLGLGGPPGGGPAPAPLPLVPLPGGGPGSGAAVSSEPGAASPGGVLVHGGVGGGAIGLVSGGAVGVVSRGAIRVGGGSLVSVVVVVTGSLLSGAVGVSRGSSSTIGVYWGSGVVIIISRGGAIGVISWGSTIAVLSRRSTIGVISGGRSAIGVSGGGSLVIVVVISRGLGGAVAVHRGGGGVGVGGSLVASGGHSGLLAASSAGLEPVPSSSSVLLAGVAPVSTATVGQRSAVASSVVPGTVESISSHEGEKACEQREISFWRI